MVMSSKSDNLFSCSVVALDPNTGKRKWHFSSPRMTFMTGTATHAEG